MEGASLDALEALYRNRYPDFLRTATAIADSREGGRDAVHDAFVAAIRARRTYRSDGTLEAWVWPMVVRSARRRRPRRTAVDHDDAVWSDPDSGDTDLRRTLVRLPERQRLLLFLRYYGDLDYRTIAQVAGVTIGAVGAELHAARAAVRRHLEEVTADD